MLSRNRQMLACNRRVEEMFGAARHALVGCSFESLYPTHDEFLRTGERIIAALDADGRYADERVMRRVDAGGALFWCRVSGRALDPRHPLAEGIWSFEDLSSRRQLRVELTPREREIFGVAPQAPAPAAPRPTASTRPLRVILRQQDDGACRLLISGRMADVCAELDRLALH